MLVTRAKIPLYTMLVSILLFAPTYSSSETMDHSQHEGMMQHGPAGGSGAGHENHDEHAAHRAMIAKKYKTGDYIRNVSPYNIDGLSLVRMDEQKVSLADELKTDEPVLLNFIFTSCATVCPVLSATFSQFQNKLGSEVEKIKMVSISIDPEYDTPTKLREYAAKFDAGPQWQFYTGTISQSEGAQRAFDAYRGGKMSHIPLTFLRASKDQPWIRLEGFTSAIELLDEYRRLANS